MKRSDRLALPRLDVLFAREVAAFPRLLVLGGRAPSPAWLRAVADGKEVWAVDRGAEACRAAGILPFRAVGDFDSAGADVRQWLVENGVPLDAHPADKDLTDFQLALDAGDLLVTGCWGGRFDHAFANIFSSLWGAERGARVLAFADATEVLFPLHAPEFLELTFGTPPEAVSLLPLSGTCGGVDIRGVKWGLDQALLSQSLPYAISNIPTGVVRVALSEGVLGVYVLLAQVLP